MEGEGVWGDFCIGSMQNEAHEAIALIQSFRSVPVILKTMVVYGGLNLPRFCMNSIQDEACKTIEVLESR